MARSKFHKTEEEKVNKMTIYFDKRAEQMQEAEEESQIEQEIEEQLKKEAAIKAVSQVVSFFTKPLVLMLLWNWLMPGIFGLATIGYLKAFGLYLISRILFNKND